MISDTDLSFDENAAIDRLFRFLAVEGVTGQEKAIARAVARELELVGVLRRAIRHDHAHQRIPLPTQTGNLIVHLPGTRPGPRLLFSAHLDTVPLCAGVVPEHGRDRILSRGNTALGGDDRTGVACLVTLAATLLRNNLPHPPLTLLFTVREESGLFGARYLDPADLGGPVMGFNVDGRSPGELTVGAVGAERWEVEITGRAAHAGVHPEQGISATMVAALALAEIQQGGWFGKVHQPDGDGTSNVGRFAGRDGKSAGEATNVVTDFVHIHGESRSHDARFAKAITRAYRAAFAGAAEKITNDKGRKAKVKFTSRLDYHPFRLKDDAAVVRHAQAAAVRAGLQPSLRIGNGGLDANWLVRHGIPTITFGAGQNNIHTIDEYVDVPLFLKGCRMALALAASEG
ncbi:MAG TPA: M20/M25/M40 family metallo-hydrolase [Gemmataceae bacterium]|nr:M20/M25/M40 family metallo-hydrolase [Gemmataceae bacterium]